MAPGIRPAATSPLMKPSIGASFSTDNAAPGRGPNGTPPASEGAVMASAMIIPVNSLEEGADNVDTRGNIDVPDQSLGCGNTMLLGYCRGLIQLGANAA